MKEFINEFHSAIISSEKKLKSINKEQSSFKPSPNKWSCKQILGHLVDSSINNLTRFINGQFQEDLIFPGYDQNKWVDSQNYQTADWIFIIEMWKSNNIQIARVLEQISQDVLSRPHQKHNFHVIGFTKLPEDKSVTLEYLFRDYVDHMVHHLNQIFSMNAIDGI